MSKRTIITVCIMIAVMMLSATPLITDFGSLLNEAQNGNLNENDLNELIGEIHTHQIDALRDVMNNPRAYFNYINPTPSNRSHADFTYSRFTDTEPYAVDPDNVDPDIAGDFGFVIVNIGDVNGAGAEGAYDAIAVGSPFYNNNTGRVYIYLGQTGDQGTTVLTFDHFDADVVIEGENVGDMFGYSIVGNADLEANGTSDLVVGAPRYGLNETGKVYYFDGLGGWTHTANPVVTTVQATAADDAIVGSNDYEWFGFSIDLGDFDDNGAVEDIVVGAPRFNNFQGRAYHFFGAGSGTFATDTDNADKTFTGSNTGDRFGWDVAAVDVNGAGFDEAIIGAYGANNNTGQTQLLRSWNEFAALDVIEYDGDYAYGAEGDNIAFIDISDETAPFVTGYIDMGAAVIDFEVYGNFVYALVGTDLVTIDVTDKDNPSIHATDALGYTGIKIVDNGTGLLFFISEATGNGTIHRCTNASVTVPAMTLDTHTYTHSADTITEESVVVNTNRVFVINETDNSIISLLPADLTTAVEGIVGSRADVGDATDYDFGIGRADLGSIDCTTGVYDVADAVGTVDIGVGRFDPGSVNCSGGAGGGAVDTQTFTVTNANVNGGGAVTVTIDATAGEANVAQLVTALNLALSNAPTDLSSHFETYANGNFVGFRPIQNTGPLGAYTLTSGTCNIATAFG